VATLAAFLLPPLARAWSVPRAHALCLAVGAAGFVGLFAITNPWWLLTPMVGIGIAWASILTMPYVLLARWLPAGKLGVYMGLFNMFVVLPQLIVATVMGGVLEAWFPQAPEGVMLIGAALLTAAALAARLLPREAAGSPEAAPDVAG
jgi:maltose/moltooligosaccharide transporter